MTICTDFLILQIRIVDSNSPVVDLNVGFQPPVVSVEEEYHRPFALSQKLKEFISNFETQSI